jgi:hypothetical protein
MHLYPTPRLRHTKPVSFVNAKYAKILQPAAQNYGLSAFHGKKLAIFNNTIVKQHRCRSFAGWVFQLDNQLFNVSEDCQIRVPTPLKQKTVSLQCNETVS